MFTLTDRTLNYNSTFNVLLTLKDRNFTRLKFGLILGEWQGKIKTNARSSWEFLQRFCSLIHCHVNRQLTTAPENLYHHSFQLAFRLTFPNSFDSSFLL